MEQSRIEALLERLDFLRDGIERSIVKHAIDDMKSFLFRDIWKNQLAELF